MDSNEINARLIQAAAAGTAERSQMIDRVTDKDRGNPRSLLMEEGERDRDFLRSWNRVSSEFSAVDAVELEVRMTLKWSGLDQNLVKEAAEPASVARQSPEISDEVFSAPEAIDTFHASTRMGLSGSSEDGRRADDPAAGMNRILNRSLTEDLTRRIDTEYLAGYGSRLQAGSDWLAADPAGRTALETDIAEARVGAYRALDDLIEVVEADVDYEEHLRDPDEFALGFVSPRLDAALVHAAGYAGRWDDGDPVIRHQLDRIVGGTVMLPAAPSVRPQDMREVRFNFSHRTLRDGEAGLVGMARAQNERAAKSFTTAPPEHSTEILDVVARGLQAQRGTGRSAAASMRPYTPPPQAPGMELGR